MLFKTKLNIRISLKQLLVYEHSIATDKHTVHEHSIATDKHTVRRNFSSLFPLSLDIRRLSIRPLRLGLTVEWQAVNSAELARQLSGLPVNPACQAERQPVKHRMHDQCISRTLHLSAGWAAVIGTRHKTWGATGQADQVERTVMLAWLELVV